MIPKEIRLERSRAFAVLLVTSLFAIPGVHAQVQIPRAKIADLSVDLGRIDATAALNLTVRLKMHNQEAFERAVAGIYTPGSPTYHRWMTSADLAPYLPTADEVRMLTGALRAQGLSVVSVSADNLSVRVQGPAAAVESAFGTELHEFEFNGTTFHANATPAVLAAPAGSLVHAILGLSAYPIKPYIRYQVDPSTGQPLARQPDSNGFSDIATNNCFGLPIILNLSSQSGAATGAFFGIQYNPNPNLVCGWTPAQIQAHYGLTAAYSQGLDGTGQTIVVTVGPTDAAQLQSDVAQFAGLAGLPPINSSNFTVLFPDGPAAPTQGPGGDWLPEADMDAEWVHAIAPGARIVVEIMPAYNQDITELVRAIDYARQNALGNVISNSWGGPELAFDSNTVQGIEQVLQMAAAAGIAVNFATGDGVEDTPSGGWAGYPASSPYATGVGGTSIGLPNGTPAGAEVGWGADRAYLTDTSSYLLDPPRVDGYLGGSTGGGSILFAKPSWQSSLAGTVRQEPDIAALGDFETGGVVVTGGKVRVGGGTSLACPLFSAIWALANQKAGTSLGQAAPLLYRLPGEAINDVLPWGDDATNVSGIITDSSGSTHYAPESLLGQLYNTKQFFSVFHKVMVADPFDPLGWAVFSFGTDRQLTVTPGWDNVTGLGTPNGLAFIDASAALR